ncbi:MAG: hypothetical protein ACREI3_13020 [Nitrospirales bacterium]
MDHQTAHSLFLQYLNTCNLALAQHRDAIPHKQILELVGTMLRDRPIGVVVYAENPDHPLGQYTIRFSGGSFDVVAHERQKASLDWKVRVSYLQRIVDHSDDYIAHPERLEWDWLKSRLGLHGR